MAILCWSANGIKYVGKLNKGSRQNKKQTKKSSCWKVALQTEDLWAIGSGKLYKKLALRNVIEHADHGSILDMGSTPF